MAWSKTEDAKVNSSGLGINLAWCTCPVHHHCPHVHHCIIIDHQLFPNCTEGREEIEKTLMQPPCVIVCVCILLWLCVCVFVCAFVVAPCADRHDGYQAAPGREEVALACVPTSTKLSNLVRFEVFSLYLKFNRFDIFTCIQTISLDLYLEIKDWGSGCNKTPNKPK